MKNGNRKVYGYDLAYIKFQLKYWNSMLDKYYLLEKKRTGLYTLPAIKAKNKNRVFITKINLSNVEIESIFGCSEYVLAARINRVLTRYPYSACCFWQNGKAEFVYTNFVCGCPEFPAKKLLSVGKYCGDKINLELLESVQKIIEDYRRWEEASKLPLEDASIQQRFVYKPMKEHEERDREKYPKCEYWGCDDIGKYKYDGRNYCAYHRRYDGSGSK